MPLVAAALLLVMAGYFGAWSRTAADPGQLQLLAGLCAGSAVGVLLLTILRRR